MDIRAAIRAEQGWHDWNDTELANRAGIVQSTLHRRMAGQDFKTEELEKIATAFNMKLSELIAKAERSKKVA